MDFPRTLLSNVIYYIQACRNRECPEFCPPAKPQNGAYCSRQLHDDTCTYDKATCCGMSFDKTFCECIGDEIMRWSCRDVLPVNQCDDPASCASYDQDNSNNSTIPKPKPETVCPAVEPTTGGVCGSVGQSCGFRPFDFSCGGNTGSFDQVNCQCGTDGKWLCSELSLGAKKGRAPCIDFGSTAFPSASPSVLSTPVFLAIKPKNNDVCAADG